MTRTLQLLLLVLLQAGTVQAEDRSPPGLTGKLQYYFDSRDFNTINGTLSISDLPGGFRVFGYTNLHGRQGQTDSRYDIHETVSEYRLSYDLPPKSFGLEGLSVFSEVNYASPGRRTIGRFGPGYRFRVALPESFGGKLATFRSRVGLIETDGEGWQTAVSYFIPFGNALSLNGFADYSIRPGRSNRWNDESQLNLRVLGALSLVLEFRHNGFLSGVPGKDSVGWAPGIKFDFEL